MAKLFLKLYSILFIALAVFVFGAANLSTILRGTLEAHTGDLAQGTIMLLEQELVNTHQSDWPPLINKLNSGGGYPLDIQSLQAFALSDDIEQRLIRQGIALQYIDDLPFLYKRLDNSDTVIKIPFEQTEYEHNQQLAASTFQLLERALFTQPEHAWQDTVTELGEAFTFPLTLISLDELSLPERQQEDIRHGRIAWQRLSDQKEYLYYRLTHTNYVLRIGPFEEPLTLSYLQSILLACLAAIVALAVLLWTYPLWRDLKRLSHVATAFGSGDFNARAALPKRSALYRLAGTFDTMAERIQGLISSHKELTNAVSHELRTPLARLRFGLEMLENAPDASTRQRFSASMNTDIEELENLVTELLTYARFDRNAPTLTFQHQRLQPWLKEFAQHAQLGMGTIDLEWRAPENVLAEFEPKLMTRAMNNLVQNARRYAANKVVVSVEASDTGCLIHVDDDGPGIPADERTKIFEPFTRLDASRDRGTGGHGLGLAIVKRIAQWHGGNAEVSESPLGGARFTVSWPGQGLPQRPSS